MTVKDYLRKLTDVFPKTKDSNIGKLFLIVEEQITQLLQDFGKIEKWRSIDVAKGATLDHLGSNYNQPRGRSTDEIYRALIRGKVARNSSDGSINKIIHALAITLDCHPWEIEVANANQEDWHDEPAALIVKRIPLDALNTIGLTIGQFSQIVQNVVAGGVKVQAVNIEGTFSFASGTEVELSTNGFADLEGTTGGTLGSVFEPSTTYRLPITRRERYA